MDAQLLFSYELLVAPVVKKGAHTKNVCFPEGAWIDYNNKQMVYTGEQWATVDAPSPSVSMFVKQGPAIPTMPVMDCTHEKSAYPLTLEVFPAQGGAQAAFALYGDEGEDLGYQRDELIEIPIICNALVDGHKPAVSTREEKGYIAPGPRNLLFRIYSVKAPKGIAVKGKKTKKTKPERLEEDLENDTKTVAWSWNKKTSVCSVRILDRSINEKLMTTFG